MPRGGKRDGAGRPKKAKLDGPRPVDQVLRAGRPRPRTLKAAIRQAKSITGRLLDELDAVTTHYDEIEDLIIDETAGDRDSRRRSAMLRAVSLGARAAALKLLIAAANTWAELERPAIATKPAGKGKKAQAQDAAQTAGQGSEWGSDLDTTTSSVN